MIASIIIPAYNSAATLHEAIESALAQTVPCQIIIVDDGSTDDTSDVLSRFDAWTNVVCLSQKHAGPSVARNAGLEYIAGDYAAGEFVMFLDADDIIAPTKVEEQLAEFTDDIGWVLCDVRINDAATGRSVLASDRYDYAEKKIGGWIQPLLSAGNFIPIMSPLVRRSVLERIRFDDDKVPEDWHFWHQVAGAARVRYLDRVLATYRKSRTGRSRIPLKARKIDRNVVLPLRLNLGCGTPATRSWHPIAGMVNLDKSMGWAFEDGLGEFVDGSVAGISVSHALMYLGYGHWPRVFGEFARVLAPGGVVRITEDDSISEISSRYGGWRGSEPAQVLMDARMVMAALRRAGLAAHEVQPTFSHFTDKSLCQAQHGSAPDCFWVEGVKQTAVLFSPHSDDETLFASFTILRYRPRVVVCFPSSGDYGDTAARTAETIDAMSVLGGNQVEQWNGGDLVERMREFDRRARPTMVFAPSPRASHPDHIAVALAAAAVFGNRVTRYHTYDASGKVRDGDEVEFEPAWIGQKLRALARYESQINHPRACGFFAEDLREYIDQLAGGSA